MGRGQKWYRKQRIQRTYMYNLWTCTKGGECWRVGAVHSGGGIKGGKLGKL